MPRKTRFWLIFVLAVLGSKAIAQEKRIQHLSALSIGVNHIDRNLRLDHILKINRHRLGFGAKFNLWWYPIDDGKLLLRERALAENFQQRFGAQIGYSFDICTVGGSLVLFTFADVQYSRTAFWVQEHDFAGATTIPGFSGVYPLYGIVKGKTSASHVFENTVGAGVRFPISKKLAIVESNGFGLAFTKLRDFPETGSEMRVREWILPHLRVGLMYEWGRPRPEQMP